MAVEVLKSRGVPEERILFLNLIASPSGVADFAERFPKLRVVTAFIDQGLDEKKYDLFAERSVMSTNNVEQVYYSRPWRLRRQILYPLDLSSTRRVPYCACRKVGVNFLLAISYVSEHLWLKIDVIAYIAIASSTVKEIYKTILYSAGQDPSQTP